MESVHGFPWRRHCDVRNFVLIHGAVATLTFRCWEVLLFPRITLGTLRRVNQGICSEPEVGNDLISERALQGGHAVADCLDSLSEQAGIGDGGGLSRHRVGWETSQGFDPDRSRPPVGQTNRFPGF